MNPSIMQSPSESGPDQKPVRPHQGNPPPAGFGPADGGGRAASVERSQARMLEPVAGGARLGRAVKKPFGGTEVPPVKRLVELHQKLVQGLSSARETEAESLKLADRLLRTVIQYESLQARIQQQQAELELDKRKLQLAEKKAAPAGTAGEISVAANLTREEREARIREIYGR